MSRLRSGRRPSRSPSEPAPTRAASRSRRRSSMVVASDADDGNRAARLAGPRRRRGRPRGRRAQHQRAPPRARQGDAAAGLPQGQGAARDGDPAARPRDRCSTRGDLESSLAEWYERALLDAGVNPVGDPQLRSSRPPRARAKPLSFTFEVGVRPSAELGEYKGLEVGRAETEVPDEAVETEVEPAPRGLRQAQPGRARGQARATSLLIDFEGKIDGEPFEGGKAQDYLLELGAGRVLPSFEQALAGASQATSVRSRSPSPTTIPPRSCRQDGRVRRQGQGGPREGAPRARRRLRLRGLRVRHPRGAARRHHGEDQADPRPRRSPSASARTRSTPPSTRRRSTCPDSVIQARAEEMWRRVERQLQQQGMDPESYLQMQGKTREELIERGQARRRAGAKREAVLEAVADAEDIEITEEESSRRSRSRRAMRTTGIPSPRCAEGASASRGARSSSRRTCGCAGPST